MAGLLVLAAGRPVFARDSAPDAVNVLLLFSWSKDMPWQRAIESGLKRTIADKQLSVGLYVEYVDAGRFPLTELKEGFFLFLKSKYSRTRIDMVVSEGFPAALMMNKAANLFPTARKLVVQSPRNGEHTGDKALWQLFVQHDYVGAISAMLAVYDPARLVVVIDVIDTAGKKRLAEFKQALRTVAPALSVTYLTGPTLEAIVHRTQMLPPRTAIFYLLFFHDGKGARLTPFQAVEQIARTANAPVFSHWDTLMGSGILGGYLLSGEKVGNSIVEAIAAFSGKGAWGSVDTADLCEHQFDERQLKRWRIDQRRLPAQSRILFHTPGLFETYRVEMSVLLSFIAMLVLFVLALAFETRQRRKTAERLKQSQERLNAIFRANPDPIVVFDTGGSVQYMNPEFEQKFGWTKSQLEGWQVRFVAEAYREAVKTMVHKVITKGGPVRIEVSGLSKDERTMEMIASAAMIRGADGGCAGVVINLTDISEQKRLELRLQQARKMESVGRLAGGVAHDFNNMLNVILGYTEMAVEQVDAAHPLYDALMEIQEAARRSAGVTQQLLAFARKQTIAPEVLDLNQTVHSMLSMLRRLVGEGVDLVWVPAKTVWSVKIDPSQVDQILANLCINGRDAVDGVGKLILETGNTTFDEAYCDSHPGFITGDFVLLAVSDNGCGMDKTTLKNLFEPFFTTKDVDKGTGLGLATVYGIVKQNNGFINVYSELDEGTTFRIYLPRHESAVKQISETGLDEAERQGSETILLVEDEPSILKMATQMLERLGYEVLSARKPGQALNLARSHDKTIHLLMTDVVMPEMNGRNLAETLRSTHPELKCLYMSGYTANVIAHHGVLDEGVHFIPKPFSKKQLSGKVREVLDGVKDIPDT